MVSPRLLTLLALVFAAILITAIPAQSCSRVLWNENGRGHIVGRNMDWFEDMHSNLWILPRGMHRQGLTPENPLTWTSKYGSLVVTGYECVSADGINEKGLACHFLYLPETKTGPRDPRVPGLTISLWTQYYLDNFEFVADAVKDFEEHPYQLVMAVEPKSKKPGTVHIALEDATGDSAIMECIDGKIRIYHDRSYTVMTNQPTFDKQLENLRQYRGFGGDKRLPGTHEPADRFVRAAYYVKHLPQPNSQREAVAAMLSVMRNVSAPFGIADPERPNVSTTIWRSVTDITNGVFYYDSVFSPQIFWINTRKIDFSPDQPVKKLTVVDNFSLTGEVSNQFQPTKMFTFLGP